MQKENRTWLRIINSCNSKCIFCLDSDSQNSKIIDEKIIKNQIKKWYKKWFFNKIIISGWEASIHPKFHEFIKYAREIWYKKIQTITNWQKFESLDFCNIVINSWLDEITFSLHWHNSKLHDFLTWIPGSFKKALKWLINIKKYFPKIIVNIDIVLNKINIDFIPEMIKFYNKLWVYEFDLLQIIPFWRAVSNKKLLFYNPEKKLKVFKKIWELSKISGMYIWTNRLKPEILEWYENLIQNPEKIKWEVLWEAKNMFENFIRKWIKPDCFWEKCKDCFLSNYCQEYIYSNKKILNKKIKIIINEREKNISKEPKYFILRWEENVDKIIKIFWKTSKEFIKNINTIKLEKWDELVNIPKCIKLDNGKYENYLDLQKTKNLEEYTKNYINNLYRIKSLRCKKCIYFKDCKWIHINFIRTYGFKILKPITKKNG